MYEDFTPVNYFRFILKEYFNNDIELLDDRIYFSPFNGSHSFTDVTDNLMDGISELPDEVINSWEQNYSPINHHRFK